MLVLSIRLFSLDALGFTGTSVPGLRHFQQDLSIFVIHRLRQSPAIRRVLSVFICLLHGRVLPGLRCRKSKPSRMELCPRKRIFGRSRNRNESASLSFDVFARAVREWWRATNISGT